MKTISDKSSDNLKAGFEKYGIHPSNRDKVLNMLPREENDENITEDINSSITDFLKTMRSTETKLIRKTRKKLNVLPGQSVEAINDSDENNDDSDCESLNMDQPDENINTNDVTHAFVSDEDEDDNISDDGTSLDIPTLHKHNKQFYHVFEINKPEQVKKHDWVLVSFETTSNKASNSKVMYKYYIGQIINSNIKNKNFDDTFLININSRDHFGFIYGFPTVKDECNFHLTK